MALMYSAALNSVTITSDATQDLFSIVAAASTEIIIYGWEITADAVAATLLEVTLQRVTGTGSGGGTPVAVTLNMDTAASGVTLGQGDTTPGTPKASSIIAGYQWEQLGPLGQIYIPEARIRCAATEGLALTCNTADAFEMSGYILWEELG